MDHNFIIERLTENAHVFKALLENVSEDEYSWKQSDDKWSLLEIVCHLYDEEKEDFRARIKHVFKDPESELPKIDPQGWVNSRDYKNWNYEETLSRFLAERKSSAEWLHSLSSPNWKAAYIHPKYGPLTAEMFLTNWLAHDYLHFRQITKLKYDYLKHATGEDLLYAGEW